MPAGVAALEQMGLAREVGGAQFFGVRYYFGSRAIEGAFPKVSGMRTFGLGLRRKDLDLSLFRTAAATPGVRANAGMRVDGPLMEAGTGLRDVHLRGMHLRLPDYGDSGPTLEIFEYDLLEEKPATAVNRPGFGHIAFAVDDVRAARAAVLAAGGRPVGEVVTVQIASGAQVTWCYVADPEGNIIELQKWSS